MDLLVSDYAGSTCVQVSFQPTTTTVSSDSFNFTFFVPRTTFLIALLPTIVEGVSHAIDPETYKQCFFLARRPSLGRDGGGAPGLPVSWFYPIGAVKDFVTQLAFLHTSKDNESRRGDVAHHHRVPSSDECRTVLTGLPLCVDFVVSSEAPLSDDNLRCPLSASAAHAFVMSETRNHFKYIYSMLYGQYRSVFYDMEEKYIQGAYRLALFVPGVEGDDTEENPNSSSDTSRHKQPHDSRGSRAADVRAMYNAFLRQLSQRSSSRRAYVVRLAMPAVYHNEDDGTVAYSHYFLHSVAAETPNDAGYSFENGPLTLGTLLWRVFLSQLFRFLRAGQTTKRSILQKRFEDVFKSLAPYYPEFSLDTSPVGVLSPSEQAVSEGSMQDYMTKHQAESVQKLISDYESDQSGVCGISYASKNSAEEKRLSFEINGTRPLLITPVPFIELNLCSSDRVLYITLRVE